MSSEHFEGNEDEIRRRAKIYSKECLTPYQQSINEAVVQ